MDPGAPAPDEAIPSQEEQELMYRFLVLGLGARSPPVMSLCCLSGHVLEVTAAC